MDKNLDKICNKDNLTSEMEVDFSEYCKKLMILILADV